MKRDFYKKTPKASKGRFTMWSVTALIAVGASGSLYADTSYSGSVSIQQRYFFEDALYPQQAQSQVSMALSPQIETSIGGSGVFTFSPFARLDQRDSERTHVDIREALYSVYFDKFEVRAGIGKVFWGQTESLHLVDIINQTDMVESIDTEDKLGQPMLDIRYLLDTGYISIYALPYFRERTFPGTEGRLRAPIPIDTESVFYESKDEESNLDFAVRWQQSIGALELGISYFDGTDRVPDALIQFDEIQQPSLATFYPQLQQFSVDALYVLSGWLLKLEAIKAERLDQEYSAYVAGFEYTLVDILSSGYDLGILMEHQYDERENNPVVFGQNDLMLGARFMMNDFSGTEFLFGFVQDLDESSSYSAFVEGATRLSQNWRVEVNAYFFSSDVDTDPTFAIRRDDHLSIQLEYFF
ncbi:hypothetical protein [Agaribacter flavus]|uniref:Phosphate-selective porin O and P n=1 Tax=Agaribacter flavus TaxID=1902781 RepID=A0ABV7FKM3_9ALTE